MRGFTSVVRLPLFLIVVFTISAAAQEQPENNQFNGLDYTLQKPAKNERYAKKKFGDHLFISGEAGLILDRSAGSFVRYSRFGASCRIDGRRLVFSGARYACGVKCGVT